MSENSFEKQHQEFLARESAAKAILERDFLPIMSSLESKISSEVSSVETPLESTISSEASSAEASLESTISSEASSAEVSLESTISSEASRDFALLINPRNVTPNAFYGMSIAKKKKYFREIAFGVKCEIDAEEHDAFFDAFKASPFGRNSLAARFEKVWNSIECPEISSEIPSEQSELSGVVPSDPPHDEF